MNTISKTAIVSLLALVSTNAMAGESVELTVAGKVVPTACTPTLSATSLDWGQISLTAGAAELPTKSVNVSVTCNSKAAVAIEIADNKSGTLPSGFDATQGWRGLGKHDEKSLGGYRIEINGNTGTVDGVSATAVTSSDETTWSALASAVVADDLISFDSTVDGDTSPSPFKTLSFTADVSGRLAPKSELPSDEFTLDGSSTFTIKYL